MTLPNTLTASMVKSVRCKAADSPKRVKRRKNVIFPLFSWNFSKVVDYTPESCIMDKKSSNLLDREAWCMNEQEKREIEEWLREHPEVVETAKKIVEQ